MDVRLDQRARIGGLAQHGGHLLLAQFFHDLTLAIHHHVADALEPQLFGHILAQPAIADQHHLILQKMLIHRHGQLRQRVTALGKQPRHGGPRHQPALQRLHQAKHQGIECNRQNRPGQHQILRIGVQQFQRLAQRHQDEGKLANLCQTGAHGQRRAERVAQQQHQHKRPQRLAQHDHGQYRQHLQWMVQQDVRVKQHAHRHKKQHRKGIAQRQRFLGGPLAELGLTEHHPGKKCPQGIRHPEQVRRRIGKGNRRHNHRQGKQLARAGARHPQQQARQDAPAQHHGQGHEQRHFAQGLQHQHPHRLVRGRAQRLAAQQARQWGEQHQHQHHDQIFDHQPANDDAAIDTVQLVTRLQGTQHHHGTGHRQRQPKHHRLAHRPAPPAAEQKTAQRSQRDLGHGTGQHNAAHRQQVFQGKMQSDPEHQQHHPQLGQLLGNAHIGGDAGRVWANQHPGQHITHQGRQTQLGDQKPHQQCQPQPHGHQTDQTKIPVHRDRCPPKKINHPGPPTRLGKFQNPVMFQGAPRQCSACPGPS